MVLGRLLKRLGKVLNGFWVVFVFLLFVVLVGVVLVILGVGKVVGFWFLVSFCILVVIWIVLGFVIICWKVGDWSNLCVLGILVNIGFDWIMWLIKVGLLRVLFMFCVMVGLDSMLVIWFLLGGVFIYYMLLVMFGKRFRGKFILLLVLKRFWFGRGVWLVNLVFVSLVRMLLVGVLVVIFWGMVGGVGVDVDVEDEVVVLFCVDLIKWIVLRFLIL